MKGKILASVIMSIGLLLGPCGFALGAGQDASALARFQNELKHDGFDVSLGLARVFDPLGDWCANKIDDAQCVNSGPYLKLQVPESAAPGAKNLPNFKLRHDEAIVLIGLTPPPVKYFAFHTFIATRFYPDKKTDNRTNIMSVLCDTINNATVRTTTPSPFNSLIALIFTPDQGTEAGIRSALERAGYPETIINTYVLPASMLNLGHDGTADEFQILLRTAQFDDPAEGDRYIADAPHNLKILRVTPGTPAIPNPFPMPRLRVRGTGESEMCLMKKLQELRAAIIAEKGNGLYATDFLASSQAAAYEDYDLLQREIWAAGGSRDGFFLSAGWMMPLAYSDDVITLADDEFLMVYGVNHVATQKATYMNVTVYATGRQVNGTPRQEANVFLGGVFANALSNSATAYFPDGDPDAGLMYAYKVSRNGGEGEPNSLRLSAPCERLTLDSSTVMGLYFRMYLEPATKVGPAMSEILYDRVLKFSPRP